MYGYSQQYGRIEDFAGGESGCTHGGAGKSVPSATASGITSDRATLSSAASEISDAATGEDVRMDKVSQVQQALAAGTYDVSASAVASKVVDAMLGGQ